MRCRSQINLDHAPKLEPRRRSVRTFTPSAIRSPNCCAGAVTCSIFVLVRKSCSCPEASEAKWGIRAVCARWLVARGRSGGRRGVTSRSTHLPHWLESGIMYSTGAHCLLDAAHSGIKSVFTLNMLSTFAQCTDGTPACLPSLKQCEGRLDKCKRPPHDGCRPAQDAWHAPHKHETDRGL